MQRINLSDASQQLPDLIEAVLNGEEIVILKGDRPVVQLTPIEPMPKRRQPGSAKGLVWISDDFDEPLEEFKDYMEWSFC